MESVRLSHIQADALENIAKTSKMDNWFRIHYDNRYTWAAKNDIITLFEGATDFDVSFLKPMEIESLFNLLIQLIKEKE